MVYDQDMKEICQIFFFHFNFMCWISKLERGELDWSKVNDLLITHTCYWIHQKKNWKKEISRWKYDIWVIFDQWQKLHLGLDALSNQKILKGI